MKSKLIVASIIFIITIVFFNSYISHELKKYERMSIMSYEEPLYLEVLKMKNTKGDIIINDKYIIQSGYKIIPKPEYGRQQLNDYISVPFSIEKPKNSFNSVLIKDNDTLKIKLWGED